MIKFPSCTAAKGYSIGNLNNGFKERFLVRFLSPSSLTQRIARFRAGCFSGPPKYRFSPVAVSLPCSRKFSRRLRDWETFAANYSCSNIYVASKSRDFVSPDTLHVSSSIFSFNVHPVTLSDSLTGEVSMFSGYCFCLRSREQPD